MGCDICEEVGALLLLTCQKGYRVTHKLWGKRRLVEDKHMKCNYTWAVRAIHLTRVVTLMLLHMQGGLVLPCLCKSCWYCSLKLNNPCLQQLSPTDNPSSDIHYSHLSPNMHAIVLLPEKGKPVSQSETSLLLPSVGHSLNCHQCFVFVLNTDTQKIINIIYIVQ